MFVIPLFPARAFTPPPPLPGVVTAVIAPLVLSQSDFLNPRTSLSANPSGPFALFACTWFFSALVISREALYHLLLCLVAPAVSIGSYVLSRILSQVSTAFTTSSNSVTADEAVIPPPPGRVCCCQAGRALGRRCRGC